MAGISNRQATEFFKNVSESVQRNERILVAAFIGGVLVGTVQVVTSMPENQPHRAEVAKLLDRPDLGTCPTCLIYDPYSTVGPDANGLFHRTPLPGNIIPPNRQDPLAMFYINSFPNPNFVDPLQQGGSGCGVFCNNFLGPIGNSLTTNNMSIKVDHRINEKSALFAEYLFNPSYYANFRLPWNGPTAPTQGFSGAQPYTTANQIFTLVHTQTFTPTLINEFRASYSRQNQIPKQNPNNLVNNAGIEQRIQGLNFILDRFGPVPDIGICCGFAGIGPQQWQNGLQGVDAYTLQDDVTKIIGNHTVRAGLPTASACILRSNLWPRSGV